MKPRPDLPPDTTAEDEGTPVSVKIRERVRAAGRRFHANDNIAYVRFKCYALQIQYTGAGTGAAAITSTGVTLTYGAGGTVSTFLFADYPTLGALVTAMNALTHWTCTRPFMASD